MPLSSLLSHIFAGGLTPGAFLAFFALFGGPILAISLAIALIIERIQFNRRVNYIRRIHGGHN